MKNFTSIEINLSEKESLKRSVAIMQKIELFLINKKVDYSKDDLIELQDSIISVTNRINLTIENE